MKKIEKMLEVVAIILMVLMTAVIFVQITTRLLNNPFIWTEELSRYTLVYITFLGSALAYYKGEGLRITMLIDRFSPSARKVNDLIIMILSVVLVIFMLYVSYNFTSEIWNTQTSALQWDKGIIIVVIPVGFSLIFFKLIQNLKKFILVK